MSSNRGHRIGLAVMALVTIGCDRAAKHAAATFLAGTSGQSYLADTVWIGYVENQGGFLSLGSAMPPGMRTAVFTVATGLMLCAMAVFAFRRQREGLPVFGLTLFVAGGLSNWIDRLVRGSVIDFVNVGVGPLRTGVFNVADVAIMIGAAIFVAAEFRRRPEHPPGDGAIDATLSPPGGPNG